jgi:hypothetical protein
MERHVPRASTAAHDRVIASVNRPDAGPPLGTSVSAVSALLTNRVSAVAGMAALLNRVPEHRYRTIGVAACGDAT